MHVWVGCDIMFPLITYNSSDVHIPYLWLSYDKHDFSFVIWLSYNFVTKGNYPYFWRKRLSLSQNLNFPLSKIKKELKHYYFFSQMKNELWNKVLCILEHSFDI